MTAFTPAPWTIDGQFIVARDPTGKYPETYVARIVQTSERGAPTKQQRGNASLISVAPQLFTALVDMEAAAVLGVPPTSEERHATQTALAQAVRSTR